MVNIFFSVFDYTVVWCQFRFVHLFPILNEKVCFKIIGFLGFDNDIVVIYFIGFHLLFN